MLDPRLSLSQKLALMPASVPDCVLDFFEDFNFPVPLERSDLAIDSMDPEYFAKRKDELRKALTPYHKLGELKDLEVKALSHLANGAFACKLSFANEEDRGLGLIVRQGTGKTGKIIRLVFNDSDFSLEDLEAKIAKLLPKKAESAE